MAVSWTTNYGTFTSAFDVWVADRLKAMYPEPKPPNPHTEVAKHLLALHESSNVLSAVLAYDGGVPAPRVMTKSLQKGRGRRARPMSTKAYFSGKKVSVNLSKSRDITRCAYCDSGGMAGAGMVAFCTVWMCAKCIGEKRYTATSCCNVRGSMDFNLLTADGKTVPSGKIETLATNPGSISDNGISCIMNYLYDDACCATLSDVVDKITPYGRNGEAVLQEEIEWVLNSENGGRLAKRIAAWYKKNREYKLPTSALNAIGDMAAKNATRSSSIRYQFTRNFERHPTYHCNGGSCWWGGYWPSLCHVKKSHAFVMTCFDNGEHKLPTARAWVQPISAKHLWCPVDGAAGYLVFNSYGKENQEMGNRLASILGMTNKRVEYSMQATGKRGVYINGDTAQLVSADTGLLKAVSVYHDSARDCKCSDE